jgi:squalene monooxygenase
VTWDAVIAGGGFVGLAAAAALARLGRRVVVLEARAGGSSPFRGELIHPRGVATLVELGLWPGLARRKGSSVTGFAIEDPRDGATILLPYPEGGCVMGGVAMEHRSMIEELREHVTGLPGVELREGTAVGAVLHARGRAVGVALDGGEEIHAELTVLADGRHSRLRRQLGIDASVRLLSFTAALQLEAEVPHARFGHVFLGSLGPILVYSIGGGQARMCVDLPVSMRKGHVEIIRLLRQSCVAALPHPLGVAMDRAASGAELSLCANQVVGTRRCIVPGAALVGDAGGCWHPITATGLTSGLNDVALLARELAESKSTDAALDSYQRKRYRFVRMREIFANTLHEVFLGASPGQQAIRTGVLRYLRHSGRARAASLALLTGEVSRFDSFTREYLSVLAHAAVGVVEGEGAESTSTDRHLAMLRLLHASAIQIHRNIAPAYRSTGGWTARLRS